MSETALSQYARLESLGIWVPQPEARRENVLVSFGAATLVIADQSERPLTHWSLAAVVRVNPGQRPAIYAPSAEATELLEIDDADMIEALETVRRAVIRRQPKGGRVRMGLAALTLALVTGAIALWGPDTLKHQTDRTLPDAARAEIGTELLARLNRLGGAACAGSGGEQALMRLAQRLPGAEPYRMVVLPQGPSHALILPGGWIVLDRRMVEDHDDPEVLAGHILAALYRAEVTDPMQAVLDTAGVAGTARLLTTGHLPPDVYGRHAEMLMLSPPSQTDLDSLIARFQAAQVPASPYAYALDITGETTLPLIEADAIGLTQAAPLLADRDWLALQTICE